MRCDKVSLLYWSVCKVSPHSRNDSGDLRGVAGGGGELGCLCGKAGTSHLCDGSAHSSGCLVNGLWLPIEYCVCKVMSWVKGRSTSGEYVIRPVLSICLRGSAVLSGCSVSEWSRENVIKCPASCSGGERWGVLLHGASRVGASRVAAHRGVVIGHIW